MDELAITGRNQEAPPLVSPFVGKEAPRKPTWAERIFKIALPKLAEQAIGALLAEKPPQEISDTRIVEIFSSYNTRGEKARTVARNIWSATLEAFLADNHLTESEMGYLKRLTYLLDIGFDDIETIKASLIHPRYKKAVAEAMADGIVTPEERDFLSRLSQTLRLPEDVAKEIRGEAAKSPLEEKLAAMVADRRFSPEELMELNKLAQSIDANVVMSDNAKLLLKHFAMLWRIENGDIPVQAVNLMLPKGEECHFECRAKWYELRKQTARIDYFGLTNSIRIARGMRFRAGSIVPNRVTTEQLTCIDAGTLYITNKRIIFNGSSRNMAIRLASIIALRSYSDGIGIEKATGKSPCLIMSNELDAEMAAVLLSRLLLPAQE